MKFFIISILFIVVLIYLYYTYIKNQLSKIDVKVKLKDIDFSQFVVTQFLTTGSQVLTTLQIDIKNNGSASLSFTDLYVEMYYKGQLIAKTSGNGNNNARVTISKNSTTSVIQEFIVYINKNSLSLIKNLDNLILDFNIKVNWYGFTISQIITSKIS